MKFNRSAMVAITTVTAALATPATAATFVLDFGPSACVTACANEDFFSQTYGDQSNVDVSHRVLSAPGNPGVAAPLTAGLQYWANEYGNLSGVAWGGLSATQGVGEITFRMTGIGSIALNSLQYAGFRGNATTAFRVYDLAYNLLFSSGSVVAPGQGSATLNFPNLANNSGLILQFGADAYNGGIDNLTFTTGNAVSAIPEAATWGMMILGFGIVGVAARRRRTAAITTAIA